MPNRRSPALRLLALTVTVLGCNHRQPTDPRLVAEWMRTLYGAVRVERLSPPVASRLFAYATTGLYAGMAAAEPSLPSIEGRLNGLPALPKGEKGESYDPTVTALAAATKKSRRLRALFAGSMYC